MANQSAVHVKFVQNCSIHCDIHEAMLTCPALHTHRGVLSRCRQYRITCSGDLSITFLQPRVVVNTRTMTHTQPRLVPGTQESRNYDGY